MRDMQRCETCPSDHPIEEMERHGEVWLCPKCSRDANEAFLACDHSWRPDFDEHGEPAQYCGKCGGMVPNDDFETVIGKAAPMTETPKSN